MLKEIDHQEWTLRDGTFTPTSSSPLNALVKGLSTQLPVAMSPPHRDAFSARPSGTISQNKLSSLSCLSSWSFIIASGCLS